MKAFVICPALQIHISRATKPLFVKLKGHAPCTEVKRKAYSVSVAKAERKRPLGTLRHRR
jgi:hypothetical protein